MSIINRRVEKISQINSAVLYFGVTPQEGDTPQSIRDRLQEGVYERTQELNKDALVLVASLYQKKKIDQSDHEAFIAMCKEYSTPENYALIEVSPQVLQQKNITIPDFLREQYEQYWEAVTLYEKHCNCFKKCGFL